VLGRMPPGASAFLHSCLPASHGLCAFTHVPDAGAGRVTVTLEDGSTESGDLLIGADGIWSRVRRQMIGERAPCYSGYTCYTGVAHACGLWVWVGLMASRWRAETRLAPTSFLTAHSPHTRAPARHCCHHHHPSPPLPHTQASLTSPPQTWRSSGTASSSATGRCERE
jgi:hypothetical protein